MDILDVAEEKTNNNRVDELFEEFKQNVVQIDTISENIDKLEEEGSDNIEDLYRNEFMLYMKHIGIYEDILLNIGREPKNPDNEFRLAKIKRDATKMLRVGVMEF